MRKLISIVIVIAICMSVGISYAVNEDNVEENKVQGLEKLQGQKEKIEAELKNAQENLNEIDEKLTQNLQQVSKIDSNIEETQKNLDALNSNIQTTEEELKKIEKDLENAIVEYNSKKSLLDTRLVEIYKAGETEYLDLLLSSASLSDFISSYYLIQKLVDSDIKLVDFVEEKKNEIEEKNIETNVKKQNLQKQKQTQMKSQKVLENAKALRNNLIEKLSEEEQEILAKVDEYNNQASEIEKQIVFLAKSESLGPEYLGGTMQWPIPGNSKITSYYGMRYHPITGLYKLHTGVDVGATMGTPFRAIAYGVVTKATTNKYYGNMVIVDHGGGVQTLYAHGSSIEVEVGQTVNAGDVILKVGSTGYSTGPHAHFEVRINGNTVNPLDYVEIPK